MMRHRYVTRVEELTQLSREERKRIKKVTEKFKFYTNSYYLSLIDWDDPWDAIRRSVIPSMEELQTWGELDASNEQDYTVLPGVQHKYNSTVLLLVTDACGGICRYCFRKRIFLNEREEIVKDWETALQYIQEHREITNVILSGGDPLTLPTSRLEEMVAKLREIDHVQVVRIGTKMLAYNPYRILDDPDLLSMVERHSTDDKKMFVMTHFSHPKEITGEAVKAVNLLMKSGAVLANQTPLVRGLNDNSEILATLLKRLSFIGIRPYYVFQCRPAVGNRTYGVPVEEGIDIFNGAGSLCSGIAKSARYVMSHSSGKLEIVGKAEGITYFKYHRAATDEVSASLLAFRSNPEAYWLDDYDEMNEEAVAALGA
jgi:lysine 2,3-aminomutase